LATTSSGRCFFRRLVVIESLLALRAVDLHIRWIKFSKAGQLSGLLPTSGTTTLMSWSTLSTGSFTRITYNDIEVFPDIATPTLGGGMVSYTAVPNSIVFIAVPEPATICLLAGGAALLGGHVIRRRRRPTTPRSVAEACRRAVPVAAGH
jgi:hypothetical protein